MKKTMKYILAIGLIVIFLALIYFSYKLNSEPGKYDSFAECLTENGAIMYGTDWCSHCRDQKALFGKSFDYVNYKNCDNVKQECIDAGVEGYPTWKIDNINYPGTQSLEKLSSLTNCVLE